MTLNTATHGFCRTAFSNHSFTSQVKGDNPKYRMPLEMGSIFQSGPRLLRNLYKYANVDNSP